ncbi:FAD-dependent oxidoreductase [Patulibacter sp. NPDC049589]|uniref:NAD(P)/FAD-dependent oxidoreductase n=1 Tax=Patulibacter sp. NPDC049589 TaxID=3154731 RepID=UPI0034163963
MSHTVGIIGAGAHGATAAYHLARRGIDVVVFERGTPASGPTGRASGVVRSYYTNRFLAEVARESTRILADFDARVGGRSGYVRTGGLVLHGPGDADDVRATSEGLTAAGVEHEVLDRDRLEADHPGLVLDDVGIGVWEHHAGYAAPHATTVSYAARAADLGATFRTGTAVVAIAEDADAVRVTLADGTVHAVERLLVAAGPWTRPLLLQVGVDLPLTAERHVVAALRHEPAAIATALDHVLLDVVNGYYSRPSGPGEFLLGPLAPTVPSDPDVLDAEIHDDEHEWLATRAARRAPARASARRGAGWASLYDVSPDWQPVIGAVSERIVVDAGTSGHGFKLSPVLGDHVAGLLAGEDPDPRLRAFSPDRFATATGALSGGFGAARILG